LRADSPLGAGGEQHVLPLYPLKGILMSSVKNGLGVLCGLWVDYSVSRRIRGEPKRWQLENINCGAEGE